MSELTMPPRTGVASGLITSEPTRWLHIMGSRPATMVETVITFGRSRNNAPSITASRRCRTEKGCALLALLSRDRLFEVDHHHHSGLHRGAEECDKADPHGDAEVVAEQVQQVDAAGQRKRDGHQNVGGFNERAIGQE